MIIDYQERKRKKNVEPKGQNKRKKEGKNEKRKRRKKGQIKQKEHTVMNIDGMQNWIQNQFDLLQNSKGKWKEKQRKGNKGIRNLNQSTA